MKNQNDLIAAAAAFLVLLIFGLVSYFTARQPVIASAPDPIDQKMPAVPANDVVMVAALPGGQSGGSGSGRGGGLGAPGSGGGGGANLSINNSQTRTKPGLGRSQP